jgi:hypothetical protein
MVRIWPGDILLERMCDAIDAIVMRPRPLLPTTEGKLNAAARRPDLILAADISQRQSYSWALISVSAIAGRGSSLPLTVM